MKCSRDGCRGFATHFPKVCVPATGCDIATHEPLSCIISLALCKKDATEFDVKHWLELPTPMGGKTMRDAFTMLAAGRKEPDFDRAFAKAVSMKSKEAGRFKVSLAMAAQKQNGADQPVSSRG